MGKAVPKLVKQRANELLKEYPTELSRDFMKNKEFLRNMDLPYSKVEQNLMAGFISRKKGEKTD